MNVDDAEILRYYDAESYKMRVWSEFLSSSAEKPQYKLQAGGDSGSDNLLDESSDALARDRRSAAGEEYDGDDDDDDDDHEASADRRANTMAYQVSVLSDNDPLNIKESIKRMLKEKGKTHILSNTNELAKLSISHRNFSPREFLDTIHDTTTYPELILGHQYLHEAGSKRAEALKTLVKNNFDSFIEAKSRIDMLYEGMQSSSFNEAEEYGTRPFLTALDEATAYASRIYDPIMDRRMRAEKIQSTLSIIERYKFFFDLPHSLIEYAKQEKFDTAVREFKKGRSLLQSVASSTQRDGIGGQSSMGSAALKDLFDMVWKEVQQSVVVLRKALFRRLSQSWRPFDEQEKCIRYLFEISPGSDNPVAFYVENQHQWIMSQMAGHSDHYFRKVEALYGNSNSNGGTKNGGGDAGGLGYKGYGMWTAPDASPAAAAASLSKDEDNEVADPPLSTTPSPSQAQPLQQRDIASIFRRALELDWALEGSNNDGPLAFTHAKGKEHAHWRLISNAVKNISTTLSLCLPDFCRVSKAYIEDKYQSNPYVDVGRSRRQRSAIPERSKFCFFLMEDIIRSYAEHINRILFIDYESEDALELLRSQHVNFAAVRALVAKIIERLPRIHVTVAGHHLTTLMDTVVNTVNEMVQLEISPECYRLFDVMIRQLKAQITFVLCHYWEEDARYLHIHERWKLTYGTSTWPTEFAYPRTVGTDTRDGTGFDVASSIASTNLMAVFLKAQQMVIDQLSLVSKSMVHRPAGEALANLPQLPPTHNSGSGGGSVSGSEGVITQLSELANHQISQTLFASISAFLDSLHLLAFIESPTGFKQQQQQQQQQHQDQMGGRKSAYGLDTTSRLSMSSLAMMPHMGRASSGGDSWTSFASSTSLYHLAIPAVVVDGEKILSGRRKEVRCILFTLCNITAFRLAAFTGLVQFRTLRRLIKGEDLTDSMRKLHDLASALDDMVFHCYIRAKSSRLTSIVRQGVLVGGYSWSTAEYPTAAQSYVSEALLFLVFVHAEVTELMVEGTATSQIPSIQRQPLVRRVFEALVVDMMQAMLDAFRMVDGFGEGGAMQAVLEVMVIKQTLDQYLTRESEECIRLLYMYIHSTYKRTTARAERSARSTSPTPSLQTEGTVNVDGVELTRQQWAMLQSLAKEWARRTSIQFRCFQPADTPTSSDM